MKVKGNIELRDVGFSYPSRPDTPVFQNFNLNIEPAKSIAIVGSSGCGKSTLVSLIERFYDPTSGNSSISQQISCYKTDLKHYVCHKL